MRIYVKLEFNVRYSLIFLYTFFAFFIILPLMRMLTADSRLFRLT